MSFKNTYRQLNITVPDELRSQEDCKIFQADNALARAYLGGSIAMSDYLDSLDKHDLSILFDEMSHADCIRSAIEIVRVRAHKELSNNA